jgi:chloride channel protein, CIC family
MNDSGKKRAPFAAHHALIFVCAMAIVLGVASGFIAQGLTRLIGLFTNLTFYGRFSDSFASPAGNHLGAWVIIMPVLGGIVVGLMARYGSKAIRGHGIPEAMEQVIENGSRIPARVLFLKPISAAVSIGTGGPFGAEGPIIATGGALGSLLGQILTTTAAERKTLLAAGAAAGMAAIFGSPVSAVLLAIELLLFEFRARSFVPVALAAATAAALRVKWEGTAPIFAMPHIAPVSADTLWLYAIIGVITGIVSVGVTRAVYWIEDSFEKLPIHWMRWPALGGIAVGAIGWIAPRTLGVGYQNITDIISSNLALRVVVALTLLKFISWSISLGSGTSGGTLAPLLTIGGGLGNLLGAALIAVFPGCGVDVRVAALVGMAAMFSGASRAVLTSVVFAFETTQQPNGLLPVLAGATLGYLAARMLMENSIMTEKIARRGLRIPTDYDPDAFAHTRVSEVMEQNVVTLPANDRVEGIANRIAAHDSVVWAQDAWPLTDEAGSLRGIVTRNDLLTAIQHPGGKEMTLLEAGSSALAVAHPDETVHDAVGRMIAHGVDRLPVVSETNPGKLEGYLCAESLLGIRRKTHREENEREAGWLKRGWPQK